MERKGVKILREQEVGAFEGHGRLERVVTKTGEALSADMAIIGIGLEYTCADMHQNSLETRCGILTNEYLETNIPGVWAAGDCAEYFDTIFGEHLQIVNNV